MPQEETLDKMFASVKPYLSLHLQDKLRKKIALEKKKLRPQPKLSRHSYVLSPAFFERKLLCL